MLFEEQSQCLWISLTSPTELKSRSPFRSFINVTFFHHNLQTSISEKLKHIFMKISYTKTCSLVEKAMLTCVWLKLYLLAYINLKYIKHISLLQYEL